MAPRKTENIAYAKFWTDKQRALWKKSINSHGFHLISNS